MLSDTSEDTSWIHWSEQSSSHDHGSEQWTKALDRGGLIHISDEAFECFCAIEVGIRRHLNMANIDDMDNSFGLGWLVTW